uniref:Uncharacterized protein n=1 Tax=Anguilla anguilla TaxID=7936 RepID=A0A0E9R6E1_ANGAN
MYRNSGFCLVYSFYTFHFMKFMHSHYQMTIQLNIKILICIKI